MTGRTIRVATTAVITSAVAMVAACGGDGGGGDVWTGSVDTLASGAVHVTNPAEGIWSEDEAWRLVEDLRIGTVEGDGPELFGQVHDVNVDDDGTIYVLEPQAHEVRVFGPDGAWLRTLGGEGAGPGELNVPFGGEVIPGPDGRVWVNNSMNRRWEAFSAEGEPLGSIPQTMGFFGRRSVLADDGAIYQEHSLRVEGSDEPRRVLVRLEVRGDSLILTDTLDVPTIPEGETVTITMTNQGNTMRMLMPVPFVHQPGWSFARSGRFWVEPGDGYRLMELSLDLDTLRIVERAYDPVPVTDDELAEALEQFDSESFPGADIDLDRSRIGEHHPAFDRYMLDDTGHLWVQRHVGDERLGWEVFDPDGRFLGAVRTDAPLDRLTVHRIVGGHLYGVLRDELDVPWVVRYRIETGLAPDGGTGDS